MTFNPNFSPEVIFPTVDSVCDELRSELTKACPSDIYQFCASYFSQKLQEQRYQFLTLVGATKTDNKALDFFKVPPQGRLNFDFSIPFFPESSTSPLTHKLSSSEDGSDVYLSGEESLSDLDTDDSYLLTSSDDDDVPFEPPTFNRGRRTSISAESMAPTKDEDFDKTYIPKTLEQRQRIETSISENFLFKNLDEDQYKDVIDAMTEKLVVEGEEVIIQGDIGDYFYVVEEGSLHVYLFKEDEPEAKVLEYGPGGSFGELALMYNAPRAATVRCVQDSVLWALDRITFRRILMERTFRKRRMYESFLEEVPILANLEPHERHKIADALESVAFNTNEVVIQQGDIGQSFYIIESGEATVTKVDEFGNKHEFVSLKKGDYFGELALLTDKPRKATVTAKGRLKCATLGKKAFVRLLGPIVEIIKRNTENYALLTSDN